jgi:hypothetical protein
MDVSMPQVEIIENDGQPLTYLIRTPPPLLT